MNNVDSMISQKDTVVYITLFLFISVNLIFGLIAARVISGKKSSSILGRFESPKFFWTAFILYLAILGGIFLYFLKANNFL